MIILFDLDDTLLENPMERFLPAYFQLLSKHLSDHIPPEKLPEAILNGTELMIKNIDPSKTLEECFDEYFYPRLGKNKSDLIGSINDFYENQFPSLKAVTGEIPRVAEIVKKILQAGHKLVIATNPLFPKLAIDHRIRWANLGIYLSDFEYITNYEELHFTKPRPEFLTEILGKIGWPEETVVMVGNEWEMDIIPAEQLGMPTYYIGSIPSEYEGNLNPLSSSGSIDNLMEWINSIDPSLNPIEKTNSVLAIQAILRSTAANLDSYQRMNFDTNLFNVRPSHDEWSIVEIFSHLADVDYEVNIPRLESIKNGTLKFIEAAQTDHWAEERFYINNNPIEEINRFIKNRINLLEIISSFDENLWPRSINHAIFGPTSIIELAKFITQHDRIHISQIVNTLRHITTSNKVI